MRLVWGDDCEGAAGERPDPTLWGVRESDEWQPPSELQTYTRDPANAHYDGEGHLVIAALRLDRAGRPFTSARLSARHAVARHLFRYGRFEARVRVPAAIGAWPAWWLLGEDDRFGWPDCGEIDIMEAPCGPDTGGQVHQGTHSPPVGAGTAVGVGVRPSAGQWSDAFHTYAAVWRPGVIEFVIDDVSTGKVTRSEVEAAGGLWRFDDRSLSPILNLAVGGWAGSPGPWARAEVSIEWVRIWA
jgi:beta-glucanase (GH16 family)